MSGTRNSRDGGDLYYLCLKENRDIAKARRQSALAMRNEGLSLRQIGFHLGITPEAARSLIMRAKRDAKFLEEDVEQWKQARSSMEHSFSLP